MHYNTAELQDSFWNTILPFPVTRVVPFTQTLSQPCLVSKKVKPPILLQAFFFGSHRGKKTTQTKTKNRKDVTLVCNFKDTKKQTSSVTPVMWMEAVGIEYAHEPRSPAKPNRQLMFPLWSDNSSLSPERLLSKEHQLPYRKLDPPKDTASAYPQQGEHSNAGSLGDLHLLQSASPGSSLTSCWVQKKVESNSNFLLVCLLLYNITIH